MSRQLITVAFLLLAVATTASARGHKKHHALAPAPADAAGAFTLPSTVSDFTSMISQFTNANVPAAAPAAGLSLPSKIADVAELFQGLPPANELQQLQEFLDNFKNSLAPAAEGPSVDFFSGVDIDGIINKAMGADLPAGGPTAAAGWKYVHALPEESSLSAEPPAPEASNASPFRASTFVASTASIAVVAAYFMF